MFGISAGALALIVFFILWLVFGHFWLGVVLGLIIAVFGGSGWYSRRY